jgi:YjjG family noncanonical pyrimidine nucleotidase
MKYKWLLFDADGTLFDYDQAESSALETTFRTFRLGFEPAYREVYRQINQQLWLEFEQGAVSSIVLRVRRFERLFANIGLEVDTQAFSDSYLLHLANSSQLMAGALEVVQALHPHYQLALITNGLKEVQRPRFAQSALKDYFAGLIISEEVGAAKPDRAIFEAAFVQMGHPHRAEALMIGDSLTSDIQGGYNYGIETCWFNPTHAPRPVNIASQYEITHLTELISLLL